MDPAESQRFERALSARGLGESVSPIARGGLVIRRASILLLTALCIGCASRPTPDPMPLLDVHSHNDYSHPRPLKEALECGVCSIEADVVLVDGELLVAHKREEVTPG